MPSKYEFVHKDGTPALGKARKFLADVKSKIAKAELLLLVDSKELADRAAHFMGQRIRKMTKRKGATGKLAEVLEDSVKVRMSSRTNFTISIGNKKLLDKEVPYWAMINWGGRIKSGAVYGFWLDNPEGHSSYDKRNGQGTGQFEFVAGGNMMVPRSPIKGFHYIEYAYDKMRVWVRKFELFKGKK